MLLYGPDAGPGRASARGASRRAIVDDLQDPFRVSELDRRRAARAQPGRLVEEAQALCLLGGRRLVRVREAGDLATVAVRDLLALPAQEGFVVLEAGELAGSSSLRKLIEARADGRGAALLPRRGAATSAASSAACWPSIGLTAEPEALAYLQTHLGGDRARHPRRDRQARPLSGRSARRAR